MNEKEILKQVRRLEITAGRLVNEVFAGQYGSTFKGRGMEFSEVREYLPGDDVRAIDWNVTARMGHPYVKKFIEERELTILFAVDTSGSQRFGTRGGLKSERAAEITAVLSFSALRNNDKVGMLLFSGSVEKYIPPRKTRGHILRLIREVLTFRPSGQGTSLRSALEYVNRVQKKRAVVFLISDFLDDGYERMLRITQKRHDVIAVPVSDAWEGELPPGARWLMEDPETGTISLVNAKDDAFLARFRRQNVERRKTLKKSFQRIGTDSIFVQTGLPYAESFLRFFRERARRLHLVFFFILMATAPGRSAVRLEASVEPREASVGDPIMLTVQAFADGTSRLQPFPVEKALGSFEIIDFSAGAPQENKDKGTLQQRFTFTLTAFEVGVSTIPSLAWHYQTAEGPLQELRTPEIPITIKSVLPEKASDIRDIKGSLSAGLLWKILGGLLAGGLAVLAFILWRSRRKASGAPAAPPRPAHETALEALRRLEEDLLAMTAKAFYSRLSDVLRTYVEERFLVPALDRTTPEIFEALRRTDMDAEMRMVVRDILGTSDLAKFAKLDPVEEERRKDLDKSAAVIQRTIPSR
ncbi:MAG: DUF58 domain-containing protein [Elusimicrobia bacterium]|nr:DUF58 domain-containing protein [Elusimicrobiota bacterium]